MGSYWVKGWWIFWVLAASSGAVVLGWYTVDTAKEGLELATITRTFLMLIVIGVAGFAGRQYSKNKSIEIDYGYKSALAGSYTGLAKAFQEANDELRAKYAIKSMEEILQDPQRNRGKDSVSRSGTKTIETEKEREVQKQTESLMPQNDG